MRGSSSPRIHSSNPTPIQAHFFQKIMRKQLAGKHTHPAGLQPRISFGGFALRVRTRVRKDAHSNILFSYSLGSYKSPYLGHETSLRSSGTPPTSSFCWPVRKNNPAGIEQKMRFAYFVSFRTLL